MDTCIFFGKGREVGFERLKRTSQLTCDQIGITKTPTQDKWQGHNIKVGQVSC